ncbi:PAS domain S-box protein [Candidatus Fermentibacteria bacterium]|nr:PAS domain S-box protein [Candidatus Fermentibacteria bacterium]
MKDERKTKKQLIEELGELREQLERIKRKKDDEVLPSSEERFRGIFDSPMMGILFWDARGNITEANDAFLSIVGYQREEVLSGSVRWRDMTPPEYKEQDDRILSEIAETGVGNPIEKEYFRKDGSRVPILLGAASLPGPELNGVAFVLDITERKRAKRELELSEFRRRFYVEAMGQLDWSTNARGEVVGDVPPWRAYTGQTIEEVKGWGWLEAIHPADVERTQERWQEAIGKKSNYEAEFRVRGKNGEYRWFLTKAAPLLDDNGDIREWTGTCIDVHEMKKAEEAQRESEKRYRKLYESMMDAFVATDMDGRIVEFNQRYLDLLGYTEEEITELTYIDLTPAKWHEMEAEIVDNQILEDGYSEVYEKEYIRKDGSTIPVELRTFLINSEDGSPENMWAIVRDITDRKRAREEIERYTRELERSNRELEQFAYVASHDLQEPLRMVSSYTQLLAQRYEDLLDEDARDFIGYAVDGANRMQRLISDLLSYSRVSTRGKPFEATDSHAALGRAIANLQSAIEESGAMVTNDDLPTVPADPPQLVQLFQNLLSNAIKFRKESEPPRVHVSAEKRANQWVFSVIDNGIGFDMQYNDKVFTIFQRLHARDKYPGTGMGLAICKRIVERHGGWIWVESEVGKGSTFRFALPAHESERT